MALGMSSSACPLPTSESPPKVRSLLLKFIRSAYELTMVPTSQRPDLPYASPAMVFGRSSARCQGVRLPLHSSARRHRFGWSVSSSLAHSLGLNTHTRHSVTHGAEIAYVHGRVPPEDAAGQRFSTVVMDYWISFTVSLDPNDNNGVKREYFIIANLTLLLSMSITVAGPIWPQYTKGNNVSPPA